MDSSHCVVNKNNTNIWESKKVLATLLVQTEAKVILHCIECLKTETRAISIKLDCMEVIQALKSTTQAPMEIRNIIDQIKIRSSHLNFISRVKVKREKVYKAHF